MKKCFICGVEKSIKEFYKHSEMADGHLGKCKECSKKNSRDRNYNPKFRQKIIEYERKRAQNPERKRKSVIYMQKRRKLNPKKSKARRMVGNALRDGILLRKVCQKCGDKDSQAHHPNYDKPLEVVWLCRKHHLEIHGKISYD